jgi:hypothetical protein
MRCQQIVHANRNDRVRCKAEAFVLLRLTQKPTQWTALHDHEENSH